MAVGTVSNVSTGKPGASGAVFRAVAGTTVPTTVSTKLDDAFKALGYVSEDGLTNSNSAENDTGKAWGGDIVIAYQTEKPDTFQLTLLEVLNVDVHGVVYGSDNVTGTLADGITIKANSDEAEEGAWVFDMVMRNGVLKRIVVPNGKVIEMGDIVYSDSEMAGYELTIQAFPDAEGNTHYEYIKAA